MENILVFLTHTARNTVVTDICTLKMMTVIVFRYWYTFSFTFFDCAHFMATVAFHCLSVPTSAHLYPFVANPKFFSIHFNVDKNGNSVAAEISYGVCVRMNDGVMALMDNNNFY